MLALRPCAVPVSMTFRKIREKKKSQQAHARLGEAFFFKIERRRVHQPSFSKTERRRVHQPNKRMPDEVQQRNTQTGEHQAERTLRDPLNPESAE